MGLLNTISVPHRLIARFEPVLGAERYMRLLSAASEFGQQLGGRTIWNVSSTAVGGGVAEMLQGLIGYAEDLAIAVRWVVINGDAEFFAITKRLHNQIHGDAGTGLLGAAEADRYGQMLAATAVELLDVVRPGDIVLLHDPQTAGLTAPLVEAGARVVWRCHIGVDWRNDATEAAWAFLQPYLRPAHGFVFSRRAYVPSWVPQSRWWIIPPSIDAFSPKNQDLNPHTVRAILATIGVLSDAAPAAPGRFVRRDGSTGEVKRRAAIIGEARPGLHDPVVVQISRWDRLKDMDGVLCGFADQVLPAGDGYLLLVGPDVANVADDPEGAAVYAECLLKWRSLPAAARARILLVTLPLDDIDENAAMVNALQRHASVIAQKSLAEGFGLTVAEGMWKGRPVIGSAVGGIIDQIADGTGILLPDPADLSAFAAAVRRLLDDPDEANRMGLAAHAHIREHYLGDLHLLRYAQLFSALIPAA